MRLKNWNEEGWEQIERSSSHVYIALQAKYPSVLGNNIKAEFKPSGSFLFTSISKPPAELFVLRPQPRELNLDISVSQIIRMSVNSEALTLLNHPTNWTRL